MDCSYFRVLDTIVYEDVYTTNADDLNSFSLLNLDENQYNPSCGAASGILTDMETYKHLDISSWRPQDCLDWALDVCQRTGIDRNAVNLSSFGTIGGQELLSFSIYDFCRFDSVYGPTFYDAFQRMLEDIGAVPSSQTLSETCDAFPGEEASYLPTEESDLCDLSALEPDEDLSEFLSYMDHPGSSWDSIMHQTDLPLEGDSSFALDECVTIKSEETCSEFSDDGSLDVPCSSPEPPMCVPSCDVLGKIRNNSRKRERGPKNWEFIIRLLVDSKYNPDIIRWEDRDQKTFRFVKPMVIAKMWGQRSNKPHLSYDNFARGLRYQYTTGALKPVRERQLVYRCGPKALKFLKELEQGRH